MGADVDHLSPIAHRAAPFVGLLLGILLPGTPQIVVGQRAKGFLLLGACVMTCWGFGVGALVSGIDAYRITRRVASGEAIPNWKFF